MDTLSQSITIGTNLLIAVIYFFALPHHLATFFSPFKRVAIKSQRPGIDLKELSEVISYNLVSIVIGMILRTLIIFLGLLSLFFVLFALLVLLVLMGIASPIWLPIVKLQETQKKEEARTLFRHSKEKPGPTLQKIFLSQALGRFVREKIVLGNEDLAIIAASPDPYHEEKEPADLTQLLTSLAKNFTPFKNFLQKNLLDETDINRICLWYKNLTEKGLVDLLDRSTVTKISGLGSDWSFGYTVELDKFQVPQNSTPFPRVVGRDKEVEAIEQALAKTTQNSVIVAGEPGVGRHAVVDEFTRRLFAGIINPNLVGYRTIYLDVKSALSGQKSLTDSRKQILDLFEEGRSAGNIILVIDDIDRFLAAEAGGERLDLTDIFNQTLADGKLHVIGITSKQMADKYVSQNSVVLKLFSIVSIEPPDIDTVFLEMELSIAPVLQKEHHVAISYNAIKEAITSADRFITTIPFPEKAINIMDETVAFIKAEHPHMQMLWGTDVDRYLSAKTQIPIGNLQGSDKDKLANLEDKLHQRIVGQDEAIKSVSSAMRRAVLSVSSRNKPIGTFLFLGPTGVGKTETAKALAEIYFGNESRMLRLDMSEFQGEAGLERLVGNQNTNTPGQLTSALTNSPFAVVLLDEIEKTSPQITNLFLTLLDEGYINDASGRKVSARENIIIGTSNAGALFIKNRVEKNEALDKLSPDLVKFVQEEKIFSPEFLNRFDGVIVFRPLDEVQIKEVTKKMLAGVTKRLAEKKITLEFPTDSIDRIVKEGYDPSFGARSIRRYIQDTIEDEISKKLLSGDYPPGSTLKI